MEHDHKKGKIGKYIVYLLLVVAAIGIGAHFMAPKPDNSVANNKDVALFINNKIIDIDQKLAKGEDETDIATRLSWHKSNTALYNEVKGNKDKQIGNQREVLKEKIVKIQEKEFPELRDAYVASKKEVLGQEHINISLSGEHKDVLTFEGNIFEPKKTQKGFMKNIEAIVSDLRFKKVVYKWSDQGNGIANYDIESKNDTEI